MIGTEMKMVDGRGKVMVSGGRRQTAAQVRFLRRSGASNAEARRCITECASRYVAESESAGWTAGQRRHNALA